MQTNIQFRTNSTRVIDCVQYLLQQITNANGYYTDGIFVDRNRDPRRLVADQDAALRKYGTIIRIKEGDGRKLIGRKGFVGSTVRTQQQLELVCIQALAAEQDRAGVTIDMLQGWIRHDIESALSDDDQSGTTAIQRAAAAMAAVKGPWGAAGTFGPAPSCIDMEVLGHMAGSIVEFPYCTQTIVVSYLYDEFGRLRLPGSSPGDAAEGTGFDQPMYP